MDSPSRPTHSTSHAGAAGRQDFNHHVGDVAQLQGNGRPNEAADAGDSDMRRLDATCTLTSTQSDGAWLRAQTLSTQSTRGPADSSAIRAVCCGSTAASSKPSTLVAAWSAHVQDVHVFEHGHDGSKRPRPTKKVRPTPRRPPTRWHRLVMLGVRQNDEVAQAGAGAVRVAPDQVQATMATKRCAGSHRTQAALLTLDELFDGL